MTIVAADLILPSGEIDGGLFYPALDSGALATRLGAYITQGYAQGTELQVLPALADWYARVYGYYRAWSDVVNRLTLTPASAALEGEGSRTFLQTQINSWIQQRDAWKAQLAQLVPQTSTATTPGAQQSIVNSYRF